MRFTIVRPEQAPFGGRDDGDADDEQRRHGGPEGVAGHDPLLHQPRGGACPSLRSRVELHLPHRREGPVQPRRGVKAR